MPFKRRKPTRKLREEYWEFFPVAKGEIIKGWVAGPTEWVECHFVGLSKPCAKELTEGRLRCAYCEAGMGKDWNGYFPFYTMTGGLGFCIIKSDSEEAVNALSLHTPVTISRGTKYHSPVIVQPKAWTHEPHSKRPDRQEPKDVRTGCLTIWKMAELVEYFAEHPHVEDAQVELVKPPAVTTQMAPPGFPRPEDKEVVRDLFRKMRVKGQRNSTELNGHAEG